jgi:GNAT superfamily N-acetyltransferase
MTDAVSIRTFVPEDAKALDAIRALAFAPVFASFRAILGKEIADIALASAETEQRSLLESLCAPSPDTQTFVAVRDGQPIGFACVKFDRAGKVGELVLDAVTPAEAGRGVGQAMFEHLLAVMRAEGMRVATVGVGGDDSHAPARRAYERAGFHVGIPSIYLYQAL